MNEQSNDPLRSDYRGSLIVQIHWSPPLSVMYELSSQERGELEAQLEQLVVSAVQQDQAIISAQDENATINIVPSLIGPSAQSITTVDLQLREFPESFLTKLTDDIENHRRRLVSGISTGLMSLMSIAREVSGILITPAFSFVWESDSPVRPTVRQEISDEILYLSVRVPSHLTAGSTEWQEFVAASPNVGSWFIEGFKDYLVDRGIPSVSFEGLEAEIVQRPPFAGPLVPEFYFVLGSILGVVGDRALNEAIDAGLRYAQRKLGSNTPPDDALELSCSPEELVRRARSFIRRSGYEHAELEASYQGYNRRSHSGYIFPIDPDKPMGWDISVRFYEGEWVFRVLVDPRKTELKILSTSGELINTKTVDLLAA